ncbi:sporulation protein [Hymenobacter lapidiphilus]|uniref:Sporulation protein n=1 Tax=Hymenobacter lapidiphilus TaxID=2608003 RepID=A0A7Y7U548_9BACT|nr:sporulation protein [Hymenobacter lapidiphilus]NVO31381.1 sporulation protein [Hymenobacter lapidiphilus]
MILTTTLPLLRNVLLLCGLLSLGACAATGPVAPAADTTRRAPQVPPEDLSRFRPVFPAPKAPVAATAPRVRPVPPANQVNDQIEQRLRDLAYTNRNVKYAQGYRVLAYVGLEKDKAMSIRRAIISRYPEETDYLTYKNPIFRLQVGDYLTRLEAAQALLRLRPLAPRAELESMQVIINKTGY